MRIKFYLLMSIILLLHAGCSLVNRSIRDFSEKEFSSADWKKGDVIERGRMFLDLYKKRARLINGKNEKELIELLGEPDQKQEKNGKQTWLYKLKFKYESLAKNLIVTLNQGVSTFG